MNAAAAVLDVFAWNPLFDTGIEMVDGQHRQLVALINRLGNALISGQADAMDGAATFQQLAGYAQQHFADEERLMEAAAIDPVHSEHHRAQHRDFIVQVSALWQRHTASGESAQALHRYLCAWLTFHILEEDQLMARQFHRGRSAAPVAAPDVDAPGAKANAVLLASLQELHRALEEANARLEDKVRERSLALLQSEKMAAIGKLAAGVAHEINNPLGFVSSNVCALRRYVADLLSVVDVCLHSAVDHPALADELAAISKKVDLPFLRSDLVVLFGETMEGVNRVGRIVSALKDFADETFGQRRTADLLEGLESTLIVAANLLGNKVEVIRELVVLPPVDCVPGQINQVFLNLLVNAVQAIGDSGVVTLRSGFDDVGVWVEIADSGGGIPEQDLERLFEPFFTTKPVGSGTGLGLFVAWDLVVNKHGGRIDARNLPGVGAAFTVWLPRAQSPAIGARVDVDAGRPEQTRQARGMGHRSAHPRGVIRRMAGQGSADEFAAVACYQESNAARTRRR